ncbi:MFS general substrate transporter [Lindgomyces ingoldianus]|uniref:MFS general substrate transporter n=1 Tax=Lindgomyces ingoldianus TaxID=673940 RepID=A0ACB6RC48_9PLEO|nr:MFS general substrate transporter [Lindgomyces ingoldianus]KAF2476097.1 MFS general substrate transporter [Lindgomyces ingoldianus]
MSYHTPPMRQLVQKLDFFTLTFCCLMYFLSYLDRTNLNNAYVSGMKENLQFHGNQLNQINTVSTAMYTIGQVPCNIALYYVKPRIFLPTCMVVWAGLTIATAESTFVGTHHILGSWYMERELGKRSGIFTASGLSGAMIGAWRWLFVTDGIITLPVAVYGFLLSPDTPQNTRAPYLTADEKALAISRAPEVSDRTPMSWTFLKHCFSPWCWYFFTTLWIIAGKSKSFSSNSLLSLYMKSHSGKKYTISQLNNYDDITSGITSALILAYPNNTTVHLGAYYWAGSVYACQAKFFAWANDVLRYEEDSLRAVVIASMNMGSNAVNAWWSILFYGAKFAPQFTRAALLVWMHVRTEKRSEDESAATVFSEKEQDIPGVGEKGGKGGDIEAKP